MTDEIFVDVKNFEGIYRIGNRGTLLSCKKHGKITEEKGDWHKLLTTNKKGDYLSVILTWKSKTLHTRIHRLVYEHFVGEIPRGHKWHIHHKDHNKQNNSVDNLELVSAKEHYQRDLDSRNVKGMNNYNQHIRPQIIIQRDLNGNFIAQYDNAAEASRVTGICSRNILQVAMKTPTEKGYLRKSAGGYKWEAQSR